MSQTLAPTNEQSPINFLGIEKEENLVKPTKAILKSEYLAGGYVGGADTLLSLSHNRDYLSVTLTDAKIKLMLKDPEIFKCFTVIKNGVLGDGVTITTPMPEPTPLPIPVDGKTETAQQQKQRLAREQEIERFKLAKKYADFATRAFDNLETPLRDVLDDMMDALPYGNRVAEKVFEDVQDKDFGQTLLTLKIIKVKPRSSTIFVVDRFKNLKGFKVWIKVKEDGVEQYKQKILDKSKFMVLTYGGKDGDPRGSSIFEAIYTAWSLKQELWPEYLRWLIYSAIPPIVGYTSNEVQSKKVLRDINTGELITDVDGNPVYESDVGALLSALVQIRNASAIALPYGAKVEAITSSVSGDPFKGFRDVLNEEIEMALILQTLATSDSRHNTRAASQTHVTILDDLVWRIKGQLVDMLTNQVLKHLMTTNFANFDMSLLPVISLGDTSRRDFATDVAEIGGLYTSGFIGESQKVGIDRILGLPPRNMQLDRELEKQKADLELQKAVTLQKISNEAKLNSANGDNK